MPKQAVTEWKQFQDERKAKLFELVNDFDKKEEELFQKILSDFTTKFEAAFEVVKELPPAFRKKILSVSVVKRFLKEYGAQPAKTEAKTKRAKSGRKGKGGRKPAVTEEQILELLEKEQRTDDIKDFFGWSDPTLSKYLKPLVAAKKISVRKQGTAKFWKRA